MNRNTSIIEIKGIGDKTQKLFMKLDIRTLGDLLKHYPRDYERFDKPVKIAELKSGELNAICGKVLKTPTQKKFKNLTVSSVIVQDDTGEIHLTFFNMNYLKNMLKPGITYVFRGICQQKGYTIVMEQPKIYTVEDFRDLIGVLQPKYSLTKGLTNQMVLKAVKGALDLYQNVPEYYPGDIIEKYHLVDVKKAIRYIHFPKNQEELLLGRHRLVFDEFFSFLLMLRKNKELNKGVSNQYPMLKTAHTQRFMEQLPFRLTKGQENALHDIQEDFESPFAMNRLIQGDVGSGKTIIAVLALLQCVSNGYQGAFMAPTEVLARQHFDLIMSYVKNYHLVFKPVLLVGSMTAKEKRLVYEKIQSGEANLVIGTHALIQEKVNYHSLALVVTDEQHRFGVRQRMILSQKGKDPHVLVMSATPIPRTLAIIMYGDLNLSVINELPADRLPIKNCVVNTSYRPKAYSFMENKIKEGRQVYIICPQVTEGELEDVESVTGYYAKLKETLSPQIQIAYLHGKMKATEKNRIMEDFKAHNIDILISTTVIEVGINVPNATVMMVENAERFGLAQLHQLRGRVGRGKYQSYCIFVYGKDNKQTRERLEILNHSNDGFYIASEDLKLRGPGELMGIRQSGDISFELGDIYQDAKILQEVSDAVEHLLKEDPNLTKEGNVALREYFESLNSNTVDFRSI